MRQRDRQSGAPPQPPEAPDTDTPDRLRRARRDGDDILSAAERILSGDSEEFLRANRQQGGQ